jgi:hypothetical protein
MNKCLTVVALVAIVTSGWVLADQDAQQTPAQNGPRRSRRVSLTQEQETQLLEWMKEHRPEDLERLENLKEENPTAYRWATARAYGVYQQFKMLSPEMQQAMIARQQARLRSWRLSRAYLQADDDKDRESIRQQLIDSLGEEFDLEQKIREYRLEQMAEQLERLRENLSQRCEHRDTIVENDMNKLLTLERPPGPRQRKAGPRHGSRKNVSAQDDIQNQASQ